MKLKASLNYYENVGEMLLDDLKQMFISGTIALLSKNVDLQFTHLSRKICWDFWEYITYIIWVEKVENN